MPTLPRFRLPVLMLALGAAALTVAAGMMLFSTFMLYDDEGYVLLSLRNFAEHGRLYRDVYSQYGPFPYVLYYALHLVGYPLTHTAGRFLTLVEWSGSATLCAWLVWRVTRHSACMLATLSAVFVYLWIMVSEPNHPGGLIALVTAIMAVLGYRLLVAERWRDWAIAAGVGSAVLVFTKINIGVFASLSTLALLLLYARPAGLRRAAPWPIGAGLVVLPFALMRPLLSASWVQAYALVFAFAAVPVAITLGRGADPKAFAGPVPPWRRTDDPPPEPAAAPGLLATPWVVALLSGTVVAVAIIAVMLIRGTTPADLLDGMVLGPLRHPGHFSLEFHWPVGALTLASGSFGLFLLALAALRLGRPSRLALDTIVAALRLAAAAALAWAIWRFPEVSPDNHVFAFALSGMWLFLWPLAGEESSAVRARAWLGLVFLGQWLHPFPVPGSQIAWGTFLSIPLAVIGGWEAAVWLSERHGRRFTYARVQALDLLLTFALVLVAVFSGNRLAQIGARYLGSRSLALTGAETVRLPDSTTALYRLLVFNADVHGDLLYSLPGMFSFNLWADLPTPTLANVTHWFSLLDDARQDAIIRELAAHPRACVIVQAGHLDFLRQRNLTPGGRLYDYVMNEFVTAFEIDGFEFRVHRGRSITPLLTAEVYSSTAAAAGVPDTLAKVELLLPPGQAVGSITVATMDDRREAPLELTAANTRVELTPIDLEARVRGAAQPAKFPFTLAGPSEISLYFDRAGRGFSSARTFLVIRDPAGAEVALVRLRR